MTMPLNKMRITWISRVWLILVCCFVLVGCAGPGLNPALLQDAFSPAVAADDTADKSAVLAYLGLSVQDLAVIDMILADSDLDLLEQGTGADEELTQAMIERYGQLLAGYRSSLADRQSRAEGRIVPDFADLLLFDESQNALFSLTDELLAEYEQVLYYSAALIQMGTNLETLSYYDENDLETTYQTINTALMEAIGVLEAVEVPSFLTYLNLSLTDALKQMDEAVLYMLQAAYLGDPLRLNAASYRMDILMRRFDSIVTTVDQDMTDRQVKLKEEITKIAQMKDGLKTWAGQNIDLIESN